MKVNCEQTFLLRNTACGLENMLRISIENVADSDGEIYFDNEKAYRKDWTLMMRVFSLQQNSVTPDVLYVVLFVTCIPSIIFFLFAQKHIAEGVSTTGIKG